MRNNYVLIDFENVQPANLELLQGHSIRLIIFTGANQNRIPIDIVAAVQRLGSHASYLRISGQGSNALDFHVAFYMGELAASDPQAFFHVISRDQGFDPLIAHMRERKIYALRHTDLCEIPFLKVLGANSLDKRIELIVENLRSRKASRPRKLKTLTGTLNSIFMGTLSEADVSTLIDELQKRRHVAVKEQAVTYGNAITGNGPSGA